MYGGNQILNTLVVGSIFFQVSSVIINKLFLLNNANC